MIHVPTSEFCQIISSVADGTQPTTTYGTSVTPGTSNNYGNYASLLSGASLTSDAYGIEIIVSAAFSLGVDRGMLVKIGFDPAGGTSFGGLGGVTGNEISDLLCSQALSWYATSAAGFGHRFYFPIFIKSGTSIGAKAQTNGGTAGAIRVAVRLRCQPKRPDAIRVGSFVRTFGANTATTDGVSVTQGTGSEGAWASLGTAADSLWYMEMGAGARTATGVDGVSYNDIGVGDGTLSGTRRIIQDVELLTSPSEWSWKSSRCGAYCDVASGDGIYGRSQASIAQTGFSMTAYGVGG